MDIINISNIGSFAMGGGLFLLMALLVLIRIKSNTARDLSDVEEKLAVTAEKLEEREKTIVSADERIHALDGLLSEKQRLEMELARENAKLEEQVVHIPGMKSELESTKKTVFALQQEVQRLSADLATATEKNKHFAGVEQEKRQKEVQIESLQSSIASLKAGLAEAEANREQEKKQFQEKIVLLNDARDRLKEEFENLANRIFEEKSKTFSQINRENMDGIVKPLREQLGDFRKKVEDVYDRESRDRVSLYNEISHLKDLNRQISQDAVNLTNALKGDSKTQGTWGEVILERVLEESGLVKGREYDAQVNLKDADGRRYQPDIVVHLPDKKDVIIDAKVSLKAWEQYCSAETEQDREKAFRAHLDSIRLHIKGLSAKQYEELEAVRSLDFILMFIPIEPAFTAALESDRGLFAEAFGKNIMVVSPTTLLITLRTIQNIWRYEYQNQNAEEIAKRAGELYDKFVGFVDALTDVGKQLEKAGDAYETAVGRLSTGKGNLIRRAEALKELGVQSKKNLSTELVERADQVQLPLETEST